MKTFLINGINYLAKDCINEILIDPELPFNFWSTPIIDRSESDNDKWFNRPFIVSDDNGIYKLYRLGTGAWDRPVLHAANPDLNALLELCA
jgi:hypothetical protein